MKQLMLLRRLMLRLLLRLRRLMRLLLSHHLTLLQKQRLQPQPKLSHLQR